MRPHPRERKGCQVGFRAPVAGRQVSATAEGGGASQPSSSLTFYGSVGQPAALGCSRGFRRNTGVSAWLQPAASSNLAPHHRPRPTRLPALVQPRKGSSCPLWGSVLQSGTAVRCAMCACPAARFLHSVRHGSSAACEGRRPAHIRACRPCGRACEPD